MLTYHLALTSQSTAVPAESVMEVAAALQRQVTRDFAPIWGVAATVEPFAQLDHVPTGYWPIVLRDDVPAQGDVGLHLDHQGQPMALIQANNIWSLTASHEALEMLADPWGNRFVPGGSLKPGQGVVQYLVEVADPVPGVATAYSVNGILVSDFVTPEYFAHPVPVPGTSYSFTGAVQRPRDVAEGGYVTWLEPVTNRWWQAMLARGRLEFSDLGPIGGAALGLRRLVDDRYMPRELFAGVPPDDPYLIAARERAAGEADASRVQATAWGQLLERIVKRPRPAQGSAPPKVIDDCLTPRQVAARRLTESPAAGGTPRDGRPPRR